MAVVTIASGPLSAVVVPELGGGLARFDHADETGGRPFPSFERGHARRRGPSRTGSRDGTGPEAGFLCVEPVSHGVDAHTVAYAPEDGPLTTLAPGGTLAGPVTFAVRRG